MKIIGREVVFKSNSKDNVPSATVQSGETFAVDTELCSGQWLQTIDDIWAPGKSNGPNPTVCIAVDGAAPGDVLKVEILDILPEDIGYTVVKPDLFRKVVGREPDMRPSTYRIADGFVHVSDSVKLPVIPMIGTIGTSSPDNLPNSYGGCYGGNMDVQEVCGGTTLYLPVYYENALLNVGDVHAIQGDGEIDITGGIECRSRVTLRVSVIKNGLPGMKTVRAEDKDYIMAIACHEETDASFHLALNELINFIVSRYMIDVEDTYKMLAQVLEARCTQFANPTRTYICKAKKSVFEQFGVR